MTYQNNNTNSNENSMTQEELFKQAFYYLNSFKRHRALANIARLEKDRARAERHDLKQYQFADSLELALRALQKGHRELKDDTDDNE